MRPHTIELLKLAGDVHRDGFGKFNEFFAADMSFDTSVAAVSVDFGDVPIWETCSGASSRDFRSRHPACVAAGVSEPPRTGVVSPGFARSRGAPVCAFSPLW